MLSCNNCIVRLQVIGFFLKIEKIVNNKVQSCKWLHRTNMYLPCDDEDTSTVECTQFGSNVVKPTMANCIQVKTLCCDGMKTVASLGINCTYQYADVDYTFSSLGELCEFITAFRCDACEAPSFSTEGFVLVWNNLENSLFETEADLNAYISSNGGTANFTGINNLPEFNAQVFIGGSGVNLGDDFLSGNPNIIIIEDQLGAVTEQGDGNESNCFALEKIDLNALVVQGDNNQSNNAALSNLILSSLTTQTSKNQNDNALLGSIDLPALATQGSDNQKNNAIATAITLNVLTTQSDNNQRNNTSATDIILPLLETQGSSNQSNNAALTKLILQALETQVDSNQISNNGIVRNVFFVRHINPYLDC